MPAIKSAVKKIRAGNQAGLLLKHLIVLLIILIHCMFLLPCYLLLCYYTGHIQMILVSILMPIPKAPRVDVRKTQNYRAIQLSSILGKILDNIIITSQISVIKTSEVQFGYKSNCSTIMCSTLVIETIQYPNAISCICSIY